MHSKKQHTVEALCRMLATIVDLRFYVFLWIFGKNSQSTEERMPIKMQSKIEIKLKNV